MDGSNTLYFVSTRIYDKTLETIHRGKFTENSLTDLELVDGISRRQHGWLNFDVEVSADGQTIYSAEGRFTGDPAPHETDLAVAHRSGTAFKRQTNSPFDEINTQDLEYAAAISKDELELLFTRFSQDRLGIYRATRRSLAESFGSVHRVGAIAGHVEAPAPSADGRLLYYHRKDADGRFRIYSVRR